MKSEKCWPTNEIINLHYHNPTQSNGCREYRKVTLAVAGNLLLIEIENHYNYITGMVCYINKKEIVPFTHCYSKEK